MAPNLIALAVPLFFAAIGAELWIARRRGQRPYRFADAFSDLGCGISQQVTSLLYAEVLAAVYTGAYHRFSLLRFADGSPWPWLIALVGEDLLYYWWHRLSHEVNFLWAAHVIHHQSEDFNYAVALRQSVWTNFTMFPFLLLLAFVGVPPIPFAVAVSVNTLYQFWVHTQLVGDLGWIERWFSTPSLHRGHHAINPRYIDKNYGGILIVWDRLFGSYEPETERPVYGLIGPLRSFNPVWAQVQYVIGLLRRTGKARSLGDKVRVWVKGPEWRIPGVEPPKEHASPVSPETFVKHEVPVARAISSYVGLQLAAVVVATFLVMLFVRRLPLLPRAAVVAGIVGSLAVWGAMLDGRRWAHHAEIAKNGVLLCAGVAALWLGASAWIAAPAIAIGVASGAWVLGPGANSAKNGARY